MGIRRHTLAQRRRTVGLTQERLSELVGVDRSTVVRWERADSIPLPWCRPKLAAALKLSVEELAVLLDDGPIASADPAALAAVSGNVLDTLRVLRLADRRLGGRELYPTVVGYLERHVAPRLFGTVADHDERAAFACAGGMTELAGWMAHDAGDDGRATRHLTRALRLADIGHDAQLSAHIYGSLAHVEYQSGRPARGAEYALRGQRRQQQAAPHPRLVARLLAMRARGSAAQQDEKQCLAALRGAHQVICRLPGEPPSAWVNDFDDASLAAEEARCMYLLGRLDAARRHAERVLASRPPSRPRSRAYAQLMLVTIAVDKGRPDEAAMIATQVHRATRSMGSARVRRKLTDAAARLEPHRRNGEVAAFLGLVQDDPGER
jgi:DNA-binding XRE family transcriptional regulator